jgi:hypothetical protein
VSGHDAEIIENSHESEVRLTRTALLQALRMRSGAPRRIVPHGRLPTCRTAGHRVAAAVAGGQRGGELVMRS